MALTDEPKHWDYELTGQQMTGFYFSGGDHRQVMKRAARWISEKKDEMEDKGRRGEFIIHDAVFGMTEEYQVTLTLYVER